jgi:3-vinyl bacteriochlorophyllide hydratase
MSASFVAGEKDGFEADPQSERTRAPGLTMRSEHAPAAALDTPAAWSLSGMIDEALDNLAPSPWGAHAGSPWAHHIKTSDVRPPLYSPQERLRRDQSPWTLVQAILAPLQFLIFAVSLGLVLRYLATGQGYQIATASILIKTAALYAIMITGSIWEKEVFGKWLFAPAFFWEDVFSMLVLGLQTAYLGALILGLGTPRQQILISVAAYAAYAINASQFLWKLRQARLEASASGSGAPKQRGRPA